MNSIKGLIFDYGGTIDTNSVHWSEVLWDGYRAAGIDVSKEHFREAYVQGERTLASQPLVRPEHTMLDLLRIKVDVETQFLMENGQWKMDNEPLEPKGKTEAVARYCYDHVLHVLETSREVLRQLAERYPMVLVSNFYGNIHSILCDFNLELFQAVVESAVVGIRKPDPRIFQLGVEALGLKPSEVAVVGDSYSKDIIPAASLGCQTMWLRGRGWGDEEDDESLPTAIITNIKDLLLLL